MENVSGGNKTRARLLRLGALFVLVLLGACSALVSAANPILSEQNVAVCEALIIDVNRSFSVFPFHQLILDSAPDAFRNWLAVESLRAGEGVVDGKRVVQAEARMKSGFLAEAMMEASSENATITFSRDGRPEIRMTERYSLSADRAKAAIGIYALTLQFEFLDSPEKIFIVTAEPLLPDSSGVIKIQYHFVIGHKDIWEIICPGCVLNETSIRLCENVSAAVAEMNFDTSIMVPAVLGGLMRVNGDTFLGQMRSVLSAMQEPPPGQGDPAAKFPWKALICGAVILGSEAIAAVAGTGAGAAGNAGIMAASEG